MAQQLRILTTGTGRSGSWQCRGVQLGGAVGKVNPKATTFKNADIVVVVKRLNEYTVQRLRKESKPWVWDLVDFYPQPKCSTWSKAEAVDFVRAAVASAKPDGILWPNKQMQIDCDLPGEVVYHHSRQLPVAQINPRVKSVGYEGSIKYLGRWADAIIAECNARGWHFVPGLPINRCDIVVAFRDDPFNGYVQQHWKSNVKLANAHGCGVPFVGLPECGYTETACGGEVFVERMQELNGAFDLLSDYKTRKDIAERFKQHRIKIDDQAKQVRAYCARLLNA